MMQGQRRPQQLGRPPGPIHGQPLPVQVQFVAPRLWTMQVPKLPTEEPFIPDVYAPYGTEQEDKLSAEMIEHGYRDPPVVRSYYGALTLILS
jgi:hypothetical protein